MLNPSGWLDGNTRELKERKKESYDASYPKWQAWQMNASIDRRLALGDQKYLAYFASQYYKEQKFVFNIMHAKVEQLVGIQRKGRKSSIVVPSDFGSDKTASQLTKALMWVMARDQMLEKLSTAFYNTVVTGFTMLEVWRDTVTDPFSGNICLREYPSSSFIMDPWWRQMDLMDCSFFWGRDYMGLKQLQIMYPDRADDFARMQPKTDPDMRFTFMPESYQVKYRNKFNYAVDYFYYLTDRNRKMVYNTFSGQHKEWPKDADFDEFMMREVPEEERPYIELVEQTVPAVNLSIAVNGEEIYEYHFGDHYPCVPMICYMDPESIDYSFRYRGVPRIIRDIQYLFNRREQIQLDVLESLPTSGINVVEDALINKEDAFKTGQGQVRVIKKGMIPQQVISDIQPPRIDPTALQMTEGLKQMSSELLGINEELLGMADNSDVGITEVLRQGAALTTMRTPFDNLDRTQAIISDYIVEQIQEHFTEGKIFAILGEEPTEEFIDKAFYEYKCQVEDGLNTTTQKQMQFAQLLQLATLPKVGETIDPADIFEASTLQNKDRIIKNAKAREQQQQAMMQAQTQAQMQQNQVQMDLLASQAEANRAMGAERMSRISENQMLAVERRAKAENEYDQGILKTIEALKKLDEMDVNKIDRLLSILDKIDAATQPPGGENGRHIQEHNGQELRNAPARESA